MIVLANKQQENITSLELVEQINIFRKEENKKAELKHSDLLKVIRDEFEEEIGLGKISSSSYINSQNKLQPMFILTFSQGKQLLVRESKFVRKRIVAYIERLETAIKQKHAVTTQGYDAETIKIKKIEILNNVMNTVSNPLYKDTLSSIITKEITGKEYLPLPKVEKSTYNATEICNLIEKKYNIKVSANKIGKIANRHNLKNQDNGMFVWDKSKYSHKQVEAFRYYEHMVDVFYRELSKVA